VGTGKILPNYYHKTQAILEGGGPAAKPLEKDNMAAVISITAERVVNKWVERAKLFHNGP
jgi:hypothetical protein